MSWNYLHLFWLIRELFIYLFPFTALECTLDIGVADLFCNTLQFKKKHNLTKILQNKFSADYMLNIEPYFSYK